MQQFIVSESRMGSGRVMHLGSFVDFGVILFVYLTYFLILSLPYFLPSCTFFITYLLPYLSTPSRIDPFRPEI